MHAEDLLLAPNADALADRHRSLVCWGVMPSWMLRHPLFVRWSA
jgi:hypothetical protein